MKDRISQYLPPHRMEKIICLEETESTNTYLKSLAASAPEGLAVIARRQSGGRGRVGREFVSPEGGLYLSVLYRLGELPLEAMPCAAVAVRRAVEAVCGLKPGIKWVNDLVLGGKKLCGILAEKEGAALIIGVGLNVNTPGFPDSLPDAASLAMLGGQSWDIAALAAGVIEELDAFAEGYPGNLSLYCREYAANCVNLGREVLVIRGEERFAAFAESIGEDFSLRVRRCDGRSEAVSFGEVSIRGIDGGYLVP